jgi:uncharacterized membrane protein
MVHLASSKDVTFYDEVFAVMVPFIVLLVSFAALRSVGLLGVTALDNMDLPLRIALCLMFLLTASAHWGKGRPDLVRMVPPAFAHAEALVTITGVLEILGAVGLLVPMTSRLAAICLVILLLALFPANIRAAREHLTILGRPAPGLVLRGAIQLVFLSALVAVAVRQRA